MAAFAIATVFQIRSASDALHNERYDMLRTQVEAGIAIMKSYDARAKAGEMSLE